MAKPIVIQWFRQDLRLSDNPALSAAAKAGKVLPVYILDDVNAGKYNMGAASRVWLHHALTALDKALGGKLCVYHGDPHKILARLAKQHAVQTVYWNRCYTPWQSKRDKQLKQALEKQDIAVHDHNGLLLWEPWNVLKSDGTPYKVFTPFYRKGCLQAEPPRQPLSKPRKWDLIKAKGGVSVAQLRLLPKIRWDKPLVKQWQIGEAGAQKRLKAFLKTGLKGYQSGRDFPAQQHVSRLSPHLHFGEISPNQVWYAAKAYGEGKDVQHFLSELAWREFSYHLLHHFPQLPKKNWQPKFDRFPWQRSKARLKCWQQGKTGYPLVDAGMRELWQTGYMHNRIRMIVASFLVKNLLLHWHEGETWFWDCLFDADLANNSASWQWVAGCGADAAPYFRIFNPVTQAQKFDPHGEYIRRYVPELAKLPDKYLFQPWTAPTAVLEKAGVVLGKTYPQPLVELKASRESALAAFASLKRKSK